MITTLECRECATVPNMRTVVWNDFQSRLFGYFAFQIPSCRFWLKSIDPHQNVIWYQKKALNMAIPDWSASRGEVVCLSSASRAIWPVWLRNALAYQSNRLLQGRCPPIFQSLHWLLVLPYHGGEQTSGIKLLVMGQKLCFPYSEYLVFAGIWVHALQTTLWKPGYQGFSDWPIRFLALSLWICLYHTISSLKW